MLIETAGSTDDNQNNAAGSSITNAKSSKKKHFDLSLGMSALIDLGKSSQASLGLEDVVSKSIESIWSKIPDLTEAAVFLLEGREMRLLSGRGVFSTFNRGKRIPIGGNLLTQVVITGNSANVESISPAQIGLQPPPGSDNNQLFSLLGFPLVVSGQGIGSLLVTRLAPGSFSAEELVFLEGAASWVAVAVMNARQFGELQMRQREAAAVMQVAQALNETLDLSDIFQMIVEQAMHVIPNAEGVVIHRLDRKDQLLRAVAVAGKTGPNRPGIGMPLEKSIAGRAMDRNAPVYVPDIRQEEAYIPPISMEGLRSILVAPVGNGYDRYGTLSAHSTRQAVFTPSDERLIQMLGIEAGLAIRNAEAYENERKLRHSAEVLAHSAAVLNQSLNPDQVLNALLEQTTQVIPCTHPSIILLQGDTLRVVRGFAPGIGSQSGKSDPEFPSDLPTMKEMQRTHRALVIDDTSKSPFWRNVPGTEWIKSYVGIPLQVGTQILGYLNANSDQVGTFDKNNIPLFESFAAHASVAIQNAYLYHNLRSSLDKEKNMRAQLVQADQLASMGRMAATIAHEINNPLQALQGCLDRALSAGKDLAKQQKYLGMASDEVKRLSDIVTRVLGFQRPINGVSGQVDLRQMVDEILRLTETRLRHANVDAQVVWSERIPEVEGVVTQLKQVVLNLVLNAADAMPGGGKLRITGLVEKTENMVVLRFQDSGSGISPEDLLHLFEPFYSTKASGSGLGLWISQSIIQNHQGRITAESETGSGSTFSIYLPAKPGNR